jgi:hypothetical protein
MKPTIIERARAYLAKMPVSVAGQGGHAAAFAAAVVLTKGFNLAEDESIRLLLEWNAGCLPPWSESDLRHKLRSAAKSNKQDGYLLADDREPQEYQAARPDYESEADRKVRQRKQWPEFKPLKRAGVESIAKLRGVDPDAVDLAHRCGLLKGAMVDGHRCLVITEGKFAQARRLDGQLLKGNDGEPIKSKNLPGSEGAFIGFSWLTTERHILLVEGCVGLLEGMAALLPYYCALPEAWAVIAALSAYSRFSRAPELLASLAGKHVRIVPDNDESGAGFRAASIWLTELEAAGATVDAFRLPPGIKDIGELLAAPELHAQTLQSLFQ